MQTFGGGPTRAVFPWWACLREFEGTEARCQLNLGIKSGTDIRF
jgi:hypothetical protein